MKKHIKFFNEISISDIAIVCGKNASLGEMINNLKKQKINVPEGFATTAYAYWEFLEFNDIKAAWDYIEPQAG